MSKGAAKFQYQLAVPQNRIFDGFSKLVHSDNICYGS